MTLPARRLNFFVERAISVSTIRKPFREHAEGLFVPWNRGDRTPTMATRKTIGHRPQEVEDQHQAGPRNHHRREDG
jgi:hypothetical protein